MTRLLACLALIVVLLAPVPAHAAADGDELLSDALAMLGQLTDQYGKTIFIEGAYRAA